jgi:hypothetical protein
VLADALQDQPCAEARIEGSLLTDDELDKLLQMEPLPGASPAAPCFSGRFSGCTIKAMRDF